MTFLEAKELIYNKKLCIFINNNTHVNFIIALIWPNSVNKYVVDNSYTHIFNNDNDWLKMNINNNNSKFIHDDISITELLNLFYNTELNIDDIQTLEF